MLVRVPLEDGEEFFIETEVSGDGVVRATRADGTTVSLLL